MACIDSRGQLLYSACGGRRRIDRRGHEYPSGPLCNLKTSREDRKPRIVGDPDLSRVHERRGAAPAPLLMVDIDGVISLFAGRRGSPEPSAAHAAVVPLDRRHTALPFGHRGRSPARAERAFRARLGQRLGGAANEHLPHLLGLPAGTALPALRARASGAPTRTGSWTRSNATPARGRWRGSTTRSTPRATPGRSGGTPPRCSCRPIRGGGSPTRGECSRRGRRGCCAREAECRPAPKPSLGVRSVSSVEPGR